MKNNTATTIANTIKRKFHLGFDVISMHGRFAATELAVCASSSDSSWKEESYFV